MANHRQVLSYPQSYLLGVDNVRHMAYLRHMAATTTAPDIALLPKWTVADRLRKAREDADLDQAELAERIGVSRSTIGNYEGAKVTPRKPILRLWAEETGVPLAWLLDGYGATSDLEFAGKRCTRASQGTLFDFGVHDLAA